jgi:hypothetical protein
MVASPGDMPVTSPVAETATDDGLELDHVTMRSVITLPAASFSVASICLDCPIANVADLGVTASEAAGVAL